MEVVRHGNLSAKLRLDIELHLHRQDLPPHVGHVAGHDGGGEQQVPEIRAAELHEEVLITDLDRADAVAVDDRREGEHIAIIVVEEGEERLVGDDVAVLPPLRVLGEDLAQRELLFHPQGDIGGRVGVGAAVVDRVFDQIAAVESDGDGAPLAPEVVAELLLALDQRQQLILGDLVAAGGEADRIGAYLRYRAVDNEGPALAVELLL